MHQIQYNPHGYVIRISEDALIQMCLNGLEAYVIHHQQAKKKVNGLETYGLLWGHQITQTDKRTLYCVEMVSIDTSADQRTDSVIPQDESLELKRDIMTSFWPQYEFLGDFHTHPQGHYSSVINDSLYEYSNADIEDIEDEKRSSFWIEQMYRVGIVLTIAKLNKKGSKEPAWLGTNCIEFTLGHFRLWLKAYVAYKDESGNLRLLTDKQEKISIDCPAVIGLVREYTKFHKHI